MVFIVIFSVLFNIFLVILKILIVFFDILSEIFNISFEIFIIFVCFVLKSKLMGQNRKVQFATKSQKHQISPKNRVSIVRLLCVLEFKWHSSF